MKNYRFKTDVSHGVAGEKKPRNFKIGDKISDKDPLFDELQEFLVDNIGLVDGNVSKLGDEISLLRTQLEKANETIKELEAVIKKQEEIIEGDNTSRRGKKAKEPEETQE